MSVTLEVIDGQIVKTTIPDPVVEFITMDQIDSAIAQAEADITAAQGYVTTMTATKDEWLAMKAMLEE